MSKNKENKKNKNLNEKNLNEKEIEKVSGGKQAGGCIDPIISDKYRPQLLAYGGPMICKYGGPEMFRPKKYGGPPIIKLKEKTSNLNEVKNLQPFSDEDKN